MKRVPHQTLTANATVYLTDAAFFLNKSAQICLAAHLPPQQKQAYFSELVTIILPPAPQKYINSNKILQIMKTTHKYSGWTVTAYWTSNCPK